LADADIIVMNVAASIPQRLPRTALALREAWQSSYYRK